MDRRIKIFIDKYVNELENENAAVFAGSGLSSGCGMVDWKSLLRDVAYELNLDIDKETDLIALAQYYHNTFGRHRINEKIIDAFIKETLVSDDQKILASLPIKTYWTTNYDQMIEKALKEFGKVPDSKIVIDNLKNNVPRRDAVIYKMHGDVSLPNEAVLTKDDYEGYNEKRQLFTTALQGDLLSKTFIFIGFSFDDPNLNQILSRIRILLGGSPKMHYCFFRKVNEGDYAEREDYIYAKTKQDLKINDLIRYGIQALLVDEYSEITEILGTIKKKIERKIVFISGAAEEYGTIVNAKGLISLVANELARRRNKIVSGLGNGVGDYVINGVLSYVDDKKHLDDYLILRPFPQDIVDKRIRKESWTKYRKRMIKNAGITLFLFGNKIEDGKLVNSDGVYEEFKIAVEMGKIVIPVGCTGYASEDLWRQVTKDINDYYEDNKELRKLIKSLNTFKSIEDLSKKIIKIIEVLQN